VGSAGWFSKVKISAISLPISSVGDARIPRRHTKTLHETRARYWKGEELLISYSSGPRRAWEAMNEQFVAQQ
jgi:hypothetical protein